MASRAIVIFLLASGLTTANAAVVWKGRESTLNASYLVGAGPVMHSDNVIDTSDSMTDRFAMAIAGSDAASGVLLGQPWSGALTYSAAHEFAVFGSPQNLAAITSSGSSNASATFTGGTSIGVNVRAPGNSWALEFDVTGPTPYTLQGSVGDSNTRNTTAGVQLQRFTVTWVPIELFADTPSFYQTGELAPGQYRIIATAAATAGLLVPAAESVWNLQLTFVPLPPAAWLFAAVLGFWGISRKKTG
ncbi:MULTISPECIES: hypothetical protein [Methylomonas]|uniref:hypothetical protein n=1 Tax=Methylomonas TaxID=416 RepID=UPI001232A2F9|nr:hypothetical protein [Methylomonas rhizoryzae]